MPRSATAISSWLLAAAAVALLIAVAALYARLFEFDGALRIATGLLSPDGNVSDGNRVAFARALMASAALAATLGAILFALAVPDVRRQVRSALQRDALRSWGLATPNPYLVISFATLVGVLVPAMWLLQSRLGPFVRYLFAKEGPFEDVTFILELAGAGLLFVAAWRWPVREPRDARYARVPFAALGLVLLLVGMEEINWGQTLFGFATPESWSQINYQHETSIHNLLDKHALTATWKVVAIAFGVGVVASTVLGMRFPRSLIGSLAPHPALLPLALCAAYAGSRLHPELIEVLLSIFFAFYSYRVWFATRKRAHG